MHGAVLHPNSTLVKQQQAMSLATLVSHSLKLSSVMHHNCVRWVTDAALRCMLDQMAVDVPGPAPETANGPCKKHIKRSRG